MQYSARQACQPRWITVTIPQGAALELQVAAGDSEANLDYVRAHCGLVGCRKAA